MNKIKECIKTPKTMDFHALDSKSETIRSINTISIGTTTTDTPQRQLEKSNARKDTEKKYLKGFSKINQEKMPLKLCHIHKLFMIGFYDKINPI